MVAVPGSEDMVSKNSASLSGHCRLCLVMNGFSGSRARRLAAKANVDASIRLRTLPGFPVKHGTAITLLLDHAEEDFVLLDADCFVRDPKVLELPGFEPDEYLAAPDHAHFFNVNRVTGERFPRTHFLMFNVKLVREVMERHRITAEKYVRAPRRLARALATMDYGNHNFPRSHLRHFDTLLLLMAMARYDGLRPHWITAGASQIMHWKHHATALASLGGSASLESDELEPD